MKRPNIVGPSRKPEFWAAVEGKPVVHRKSQKAIPVAPDVHRKPEKQPAKGKAKPAKKARRK